MAKELRTSQDFDVEFKNEYRPILKVVLMLELRKRKLFKGDVPFGIKCPHCDCVMEENYYFHIGEIRINLNCPNENCGYGFNSWSYDQLFEKLSYFKSIRETQEMVENGELPF